MTPEGSPIATQWWAVWGMNGRSEVGRRNRNLPALIDGDLRLGNKDRSRTYQLAGPNDDDTFESVNNQVEVLDLSAVASSLRQAGGGSAPRGWLPLPVLWFRSTPSSFQRDNVADQCWVVLDAHVDRGEQGGSLDVPD